MIKLPNLDDQNYIDIVEAAKRRIPVIFPEWTDFNEHDPGITMLEAFAWLKEMQQYYLNRISDRTYENMLRLLGIEIQSAQPARTDVCFDDETVPELLAKGSLARLENGTEYVSVQDFRKAPFTIGELYLGSDSGLVNATELLKDYGSGFYPFGSQLGAGDRSMYIGINNVDKSRISDGITMMFEVTDRNPVPRNPFEEGASSPRDIVWEYSTADGFKECEIVRDETFALSFSGRITLRTGDDFCANTVDGRLENAMRIRAVLKYCGCEDMPLINYISCNTLELEQKRRLTDYADFVMGSGKIQLRDKLLTEGLFFVLVRDAHGWLYAQDAKIKRVGLDTEIDVSQYSAQAAADGNPDVRVIFCEESFGRTMMFGSSNGLPCQQMDFDPGEEILTDTFSLMVCDRENAQNPRWREYKFISSLALAGPYDRVFSYDRKRSLILFGDNENGEVPAVGDENIMVIRCEVTQGAKGNVIKGNLREITDGIHSYPVTQHCDCTGGRTRETTAHAQERLKAQMNACVKAVTAEDYRIIAKNTPGVRIADVKAIPHFDPDSPVASADKLANIVTLVVLPYSNSQFPMPDERFLNSVRDHVENYRLITTELKVCAPVYIKVDISADVVCSVREVSRVLAQAESVLRSLFSLYKGAEGTKFGEPVSDVDITAAICSVEGILTVKSLQINVADTRCKRDKYGRIIIPPHAVAYCGDVSINSTDA